jgi:hypothetical protein
LGALVIGNEVIDHPIEKEKGNLCFGFGVGFLFHAILVCLWFRVRWLLLFGSRKREGSPLV